LAAGGTWKAAGETGKAGAGVTSTTDVACVLLFLRILNAY